MSRATTSLSSRQGLCHPQRHRHFRPSQARHYLRLRAGPNVAVNGVMVNHHTLSNGLFFQLPETVVHQVAPARPKVGATTIVAESVGPGGGRPPAPWWSTSRPAPVRRLHRRPSPRATTAVSAARSIRARWTELSASAAEVPLNYGSPVVYRARVHGQLRVTRTVRPTGTTVTFHEVEGLKNGVHSFRVTGGGTTLSASSQSVACGRT